MSDRPSKHSPSADIHTSRAHEQLAREVLRDALFALLRAAASDPRRSVVCHATDALQRVFLEGKIDVAWALVEHRTGHRVRAEGARCLRPGEPSVLLETAQIDELLAQMPAVDPSPGVPVRASVLSTETSWVLVLVRQPAGCLIDLDERLWIVLPLHARTPDLTARRTWFAAFDQGWRELVDTLRALQSADRHASLQRHVEASGARGADLPLEERLAQAHDLLTALLFEAGCDDPQLHYLALAQRLGERVLQVAAGSLSPGTASARRLQPLLDRIGYGLLRAASLGVPDAHGQGPLPVRLRLLALTLRQHPETEAAPNPSLSAWREALDALREPAEAAGLHAAWLLAAWTGVCNALASGLDELSRDQVWRWACAPTPALLAGLFELGQGRVDRNRLALWFATSLLPTAHAPGPRRDRTRRSLAWVLRESTRQLDCTHRADFLWQPERFGAAMLDLVEVHAHDVLGLPHPLDVRGTLAQLNHGRQIDERLLGAAHQQHVIEVYLAGHFLLELQPEGPRGGPSLTQALLAGADPSERRRAFTLAALYHDVGVALTQRVSDTDPWPEALNLPRDLLHLLRASRQSSRAELIRRCQSDLGALAGATTAETRPGPEDHGLVSAWVLAQLGRRAGVAPEVLDPAVRAIVLHAQPTTRIQLATDPIGALLVLADQLFEWEPSADLLPDPAGVSSDDHLLTTSFGPRRSRTAEIRLPGLQVRSDGPTLVCTVHVERFWPRVHLRLHHVDLSGLPTWRSWLSLAQSLGRIQATDTAWSPLVTVSAPLPAWMRERGLTTHALLSAVAWGAPEGARALAMSLRPWLEHHLQFESDGQRERMALHALSHPEDVRLTFAELGAALGEAARAELR